MSFSDYVLKYLNEEEMLTDRTKEIESIIKGCENTILRDKLLKIQGLFGLKDNKVLNFNSSNKREILDILGNPKETGKGGNSAQYIVDKLGFRCTGNSIIQGNAIQVSGGGSTTKQQEIGPLLYLTALVDQNLSTNKLSLQDIDLKKLKRIQTKSSEDIEDTIKFLSSNDSWDKSCKNQAIMLYRTFGSKLKSYEFHRDTSITNSIRKLGAKLSELSADKWNPSDIYFIKKGFNLSNLPDNLLELNSFIEQNDEVIGISLKKDEGAYHGKLSIREVYKLAGFEDDLSNKVMVIENNKLNQKQISQIITTLRNIKLPNVSMFSSKKEPSLKLGAKKCLELATISATNFGQSFYRGVDFISKIEDEEQLKNILFLSLTTALSRRAGKSCGHYKCENKVTLIKPSNNLKEFEVKTLRIPVDGGMACVADVKFEGQSYKMQLRSFSNTLPQFGILKAEETPKQLDPLKI